MKEVYILQVQGWGDGSEDEYYNMGAYSTMAKAEAALEELRDSWEEDGNDRDDVVHEIQIFTIDA